MPKNAIFTPMGFLRYREYTYIPKSKNALQRILEPFYDIYNFMHICSFYALCVMHKKEGGVLYKIVYFDENFLRGGYYTNTKITTINDKPSLQPINNHSNQPITDQYLNPKKT